MAEVILKDITKIYDGGVKAVDKANIHIKDQEFVVLVGPSGCGKSTTLRMVAGLEDISDGELLIDGKRMNEEAPKDRDIAMVFQNYALYPHMSVYDNMAFGLKIRKYPKADIESRVKEAAQILDIEELLERKPKALSGGQRQRVAVGRAIVRKPKVFLFDEPLSNLDAKLRVQMRAEIGALHSRLSATMIYVTHDQIEAMTMGDKIVVMKGGIIQQIGSPLKLYNEPINRFVAGFIGSPPMNVAVAKVTEENGKIVVSEEGIKVTIDDNRMETLKAYVGKELLMGIRPEDLNFTTTPVENNMSAKVVVVEPLGNETQLHINTGSHTFTTKNDPTISVKVGDTVNFTPRLEKLHFFDLETERSLFFTED
ncbi:sn-glycerol-3-phosphate ABC transporter ATP-binding protein UgpC [Oceanispirochaeta crateris]|jgi:multiple sugar transport system ATP-binding protein|uniref:sn-glycerol-3-phosphate ABC transporter ATP-binding protein UgpC n=1 Tax=Oceanispirochaeta crateris TaxID=2518645 RepID=A0A5C1QP93_9SPIO|nr:sn-glycerol-3-phosphate ABC transporter ATP-binding protein UgpC [Oceanispirochaeta crateris]QEN09267.1 sn-glycerol-3-phosphate ABC transporter ATP-binding protein UgpC [Oceanispirochaeta crateris]